MHSKVSSNCPHLNLKILYQHHVVAKLPLPNTTSSPKERHLLSVVPSVAPPTGTKRGGGGESFSIHGSTKWHYWNSDDNKLWRVEMFEILGKGEGGQYHRLDTLKKNMSRTEFHSTGLRQTNTQKIPRIS